MTTTPASAPRRGRPPTATLEQFSPQLADQLVDQSLRTISKGSARAVEWRCTTHPDHVWEAKVYNRTNAKNLTGCPICAGKKVLVGFNDVATTHPRAAALFADQSLATQYTGASNKTVTFSCPDPTHAPWTAPVSRVAIQGSGCPQCSGRTVVTGTNDLATTHPELAAQLAKPVLATELKAGSNRTVDWRCPVDPAHRWSATVVARINGNGCPYCSGRVATPEVSDLATTHPELAAQLVDPTLATTFGPNSERKVLWHCTVDPRHPNWSATIANRTRAGSGCPVCANRTIIPGLNDIATTHPELAAQLTDPADAHRISYGAKEPVAWRCAVDPEHTWLAAPYRRSGQHSSGCPKCRASQDETELAETLTTLLGDTAVIRTNRTLLGNGYELDIVIPSQRVAIEFNGVYWHSEAAGRAIGYHQDKSRLAAQAGYQLIHVWEDDWWDRREAVIRAIAHKCHATEHVLRVLPHADLKIAQRVAARSTTPTTVPSREAAAFLEANHIQGKVTATAHYGLRDEDGDLRAVLSVRSPRNNARMKRTKGQWEVQRYATCGVVPGGFSKLLRYAERQILAQHHTLTQWISFSSDDISDGGMYRTAGFTIDSCLGPDYKYVGGLTSWRRTPKERFQKRVFAHNEELVWEDGWTEREAAAANGLLRIYDSGKLKWVKDVN